MPPGVDIQKHIFISNLCFFLNFFFLQTVSHALWVLVCWSFQKQTREESNILRCRQKTGNSYINFLFGLFNPAWIPDRYEEEKGRNLEVLNSLEQHIKPAGPDFSLAQAPSPPVLSLRDQLDNCTHEGGVVSQVEGAAGQR